MIYTPKAPRGETIDAVVFDFGKVLEMGVMRHVHMNSAKAAGRTLDFVKMGMKAILFKDVGQLREDLIRSGVHGI
jgi:hypothetical protein